MDARVDAAFFATGSETIRRNQVEDTLLKLKGRVYKVKRDASDIFTFTVLTDPPARSQSQAIHSTDASTLKVEILRLRQNEELFFSRNQVIVEGVLRKLFLRLALGGNELFYVQMDVAV
jgi:hypothetical protein